MMDEGCALRSAPCEACGYREDGPVVPGEGSASPASAKRRGKDRGNRNRRRHTRAESYSGTGAWSTSFDNDVTPTAFHVWIPGVGYVIDTIGTYGQALHAEKTEGSMRRVVSVDNLSASPGINTDTMSAKEAKRRRRREEQRKNRSSKNKHDSETASTSTSLSLAEETSSLASSSPALSCSSVSSTVSSVMHSRSASLGGSIQVDTMRSSLPPTVLATLLSMAAWYLSPPTSLVTIHVKHWEKGMGKGGTHTSTMSPIAHLL